MAYLNRRNFLSSMSALGMSAGIASIGTMSALRAHAADIEGYKALVMIFLKGGQDGADFLIPYDQPSWSALRRIRVNLSDLYDVDNPNSSRNRSNLLPLAPDNDLGGRSFSFPPELSLLSDLFASGELAVVGNIGPLIEPVNRSQIEAESVPLPARLFSHNDQQSTWMTFAPEGARIGWGGRFVDATIEGQSEIARGFTAITAGSNDPFLSGEAAQPFRISSSGAPRLDVVRSNSYLGNTAGDKSAEAKLLAMLAREDYGFDNLFLRDIARFTGQSAGQISLLAETLDSATPVATEFPNTGLGKQLKAVADMINIHANLGVKRQVFYVTVGGYDTHDNQVNKLPSLHTALADGLAAFRSALISVGKWNQTVTFTASDFGRTYIDNGTGTDHGWGGYHIVMGGAVKGRKFYGGYPEIDVDASHFTPTRGRLIPDVAVEQYAASLGRWFGLTESELNVALPNLGSFDSAGLDFL